VYPPFLALLLIGASLAGVAAPPPLGRDADLKRQRVSFAAVGAAGFQPGVRRTGHWW
jgi:hypothetical protein